ncbi:MAG: hypothetical protein ABW061_27570 [Polyangiaceae bacterium]
MKDESVPEVRVRYPLHALLLIGVSWAFYALIALVCALFMLPCVPLAPVFVMLVVSLGGLLGSVHEYARSVATPVRATRLRGLVDGKDAQAAHGAPQPS